MTDQQKPEVLTNPVCKRCNNGFATHNIRSEDVCGECFTTYITTKTIKRMETYRVRGSTVEPPKRLLFPLSLGPCSTSLLYVLDGHLQGQYDRMNRAAYELIVIYVDFDISASNRNHFTKILDQYRARFPRHSYIIHGLEESMDLDDLDWITSDKSDSVQGCDTKPQTEKLRKLIGSLSSATARAEIISILFTRLLVQIGLRNNCESILCGDSTTKLAEKTLTETAKGRGHTLPWQILDGLSPHGIGFNYPLRDILKKELVSFSHLVSPSLEDLIIYDPAPSHVSASSRSTTINDLMEQYFESVEENYPSIVANVVRTSSKLNPITGSKISTCRLCRLPIDLSSDGAFGWGGNPNFIQSSRHRPHKRPNLCYGCSRLING